jgi:membrane protease YdiL (CAAX protease family)
LRSRARAGLYWAILGKTARRSVAEKLSSAELQQLNAGLNAYRQMKPAARKELQIELLRFSRSQHGALWSAISLCCLLAWLAIFGYHSTQYELPALLRLDLFMPLLLAALSPLSIYFIPVYRLKSIFSLRITAINLAITGSCALALVWTLAFIGMEEKAPAMPLRGWHFMIVFAGAIFAPLLEEVFFRELLPGLVGSDPHFAGHFLAAVLFALAHFPSSTLMFLLYFMAAAFLSLIRLGTGSLGATVAAHSLANAAILLLGV